MTVVHRPVSLGLTVLLVAAAVACGGPPVSRGAPTAATAPRRMAVWVDRDGLDEATAVRLHMVGVDELVVWRGRISLAGGAPVVRLAPWPDTAGPLPVTAALAVDAGDTAVDAETAATVWRALKDEVPATRVSKLLLDLPRLPEGADRFVTALSAESGLSVVPLLSVRQLRQEMGLAVARAARICVVPLYGYPGQWLRDLEAHATVPLAERLAPLAGSGVRVRAAIGLRPVLEPAVDGWGEGLNALTEDRRCEISTSSPLDRSFTFRGPFEWSGRRWTAGETVAVGWLDAMRLDRAFADTVHLSLPELAGWDLVPAPPPDSELGVGLRTLERYLSGDGPRPTVEVELAGSGSSRRLVVRNLGPFTSAVSANGTWFEVSVDEGRLVAEDRGGFEKIAIGTLRGGEFETGHVGAADAVRFYETFLGPAEEITSGAVRLSNRRATVHLRWEIVLSTGEHLTGHREE